MTTRYVRRPGVSLHAMDDGSAIACDESTFNLHAFNALAARFWEADRSWTENELVVWMREQAGDAVNSAIVALFLEQLLHAGLIEKETPQGEESDWTPDERRVLHYRCWQTDMQVTVSNDVVFRYLDRLCHQFASEPAENPIRFLVRDTPEGWEILQDGKRVNSRTTALGAAKHVEHRIAHEAMHGARDHIHWHGSVLTRGDSTVLIPGSSGTGKSSFALALVANGFDLLGDDLSFMEPDTGRMHPYPRALHIHDDAIPRLEAAGFTHHEKLYMKGFYEVEAIENWCREPKPLTHVLFVDWDESGPVDVVPITQAEAAIELRRHSCNLRKRAGCGLPDLQRMLAGVASYRVLRSQDLSAAVERIRELIDGDDRAR